MSDQGTAKNEVRDEVMPMLASGVSNALVGIYGKEIEFVLIVMIPDKEDGFVQCSTITGIKDPHKMRVIADHLKSMADAQAPDLDLEDDSDIKGHA